MLSNHQQQDESKAQTGGKVAPRRRLRLAFITAFSALAASAVLIPAQPSAVSAAASKVWTVTISGDCNGAATSDWQAVFGVEPTADANSGAHYSFAASAMQSGDTLKVINNCSTGQTLSMTKPWYLSFTEVPIFSSGSWDAGSSEGAIPNQGHGQVVLGTSIQGELFLADIVKFRLVDGSSGPAFGPWNYGVFRFDQGKLSLNGATSNSFVLASNQAIAPISIEITPGYGSQGGTPVDIEVRAGDYFRVSGSPVPSPLPPGLSFSCNNPNPNLGQILGSSSEVIGCALPATIVGTPTQVGSYTVNFVFNRTDFALGKIVKSVTFSVASTPTISSVSPASGVTTGGTAITITGTNFVNGATVTVGGAACTSVTVVSATSMTCTTPSGTSGTASVLVTSSGLSNSVNTFYTYNAPVITLAAPTPTVTSSTTTVPAGAPVLVTAANQAQLEAAPGGAVAVINGKAVEVETVKVEATATPADLQAAAKNIVSDISSVLPAGVKNPIAVVNTPDGAELTGLMVNPDDPKEKLSVPVDSVTLIKAGDSRVLISALNQTNLPGEVAPGGVLQVTRGGYVAAQAFGLPGSETGEIVLMSTPRLLQTFTVNTNGSFNGQVALPKNIAFGAHTVVMATKSAKVSLGIKLVRTRMQFRIKRVMGTTIFKNRAKVVKRGGGVVTITGAGRCKANSKRVVMAAKPGACYITVKQTAKGTNKAIYYRFTVAVLKKLPKKTAITAKK